MERLWSGRRRRDGRKQRRNGASPFWPLNLIRMARIALTTSLAPRLIQTP